MQMCDCPDIFTPGSAVTRLKSTQLQLLFVIINTLKLKLKN